ncbi:MAG: GNAT family N-acetyltransferase [Flavobacteriaceae bacterium]
MVVYKRATQDSELQQILELQQKNLIPVLTEDEKQREGFVTVSHTFEILKRMNDVCAHVIAKDGDWVVGYALCMHPRFAEEIEVLKPMFDEIGSVVPKSEKYLAMGQICIDKEYRGQGLFRHLYDRMKKGVQPEFTSIITEVDVKNARSLKAHYAVGFKLLKTYSSGGQDWHLIALS